MSGRPYARNLRAPFSGATDLDAVLPHSFRISAPRPTSSPKERAIRSAIRRRCMEKNWKKMFSLRHKRLSKEEEKEQQETTNEANAPLSDESTEPADESEAPKAEEKPQEEEIADNHKEKEDKVTAAKQKLEELKEKLQELMDQKHDKFLLLKHILVQEARSKTSSSTPAAASASNPAKKRRVDAPIDAGGFSPLATNNIGPQSAGTQSTTVDGSSAASAPGPGATS